MDFFKNLKWLSWLRTRNFIPKSTYAVSSAEIHEAVNMKSAMEVLLDGESSVTVLCANNYFGGPATYAIDCCGEWTGWKYTRFHGYTRLSCFEIAVIARRRAES